VAAVLHDLVDEHLGRRRLPTAAVVVGEAADHGLDLALLHSLPSSAAESSPLGLFIFFPEHHENLADDLHR